MIILLLAIFLGPRLFVLSWATWVYFQTDQVCMGEDPIPPTGLKDQVLVDLSEVKPYSVLTGHGYIYPGDENEMYGDGYWFGMTHLIWAGKKGAFFLVTYETEDPIKGPLRLPCRWFAPIGNYR